MSLISVFSVIDYMHLRHSLVPVRLREIKLSKKMFLLLLVIKSTPILYSASAGKPEGSWHKRHFCCLLGRDLIVIYIMFITLKQEAVGCSNDRS